MLEELERLSAARSQPSQRKGQRVRGLLEEEDYGEEAAAEDEYEDGGVAVGLVRPCWVEA